MTETLLDQPTVAACSNCGTLWLWRNGLFPHTRYRISFAGEPVSMCAAECETPITYGVEDIKAFLAEMGVARDD